MAGRAHRKGISLPQFFKMFPNDKAAEQWFINNRWPDGVCCPRDGSVNVQLKTTHPRMPFRCRDCKKFFSAKTGTSFEGSKFGFQVLVDQRDRVVLVSNETRLCWNIPQMESTAYS